MSQKDNRSSKEHIQVNRMRMRANVNFAFCVVNPAQHIAIRRCAPIDFVIQYTNCRFSSFNAYILTKHVHACSIFFTVLDI